MSIQIAYPPHLAVIKPYVPGLPTEHLARRLNRPVGEIVKLASNENPLGASPMAVRAVADAGIDFSQYPDNDCTDLVAELASHHDVPSDWIIVGAGSESVIGNAVSTVLAPGRSALHSQYAFAAFVNATQRVGASAIVVPEPALEVDLRSMQASMGRDPSLVYIANPGNPTGTRVRADELESLIGRVPAHCVVLLDEAYFEYLPKSERVDALRLVKRHPNLLVTRTFSKAYGLAGLRVGYGIAQSGLADMLRRVRAPFTVTRGAQLGAIAALHDTEFLARTIQTNEVGKARLESGFAALGFRYLPSSTNFVLLEVGDGAACARALERHGLIVRPVGSYGLPSWVRISIGTAAQNDRLLDALSKEAGHLTRGGG